MVRAAYKAVFDAAYTAHLEAKRTRDALALALTHVFRKLLPEGTVIDLRRGRDDPPPDYMARVRTLAGNDRGTLVFRIVKVLYVDVDARTPELSTWVADAVPISEKTGKDMKATAGGRASRTTVRLHGNVTISHGPDEAPALQRERLFAYIEEANVALSDAE